jgi:hypothetical protein
MNGNDYLENQNNRIKILRLKRENEELQNKVNELEEQLALHGVSNSLKVGMQTFDLCDCPYQINTWIEEYNIQANNIISINQDSKQVVLFYKAFND